MSFHSSLSQLNESQRRAVEAPEDHVLVSAGAGTGKTRVLTSRYEHLVTRCHIAPQELMAVTFTNKASQEMKHRLQGAFSVHQLWIGTFHSLSMRILRNHADYVGRSSSFAILDTGDQQSLIQKILKALNASKTITPRMAMGVISRWKHDLLLPDQVIKAPLPVYLAAYREYQSQLQLLNSFDFDDLLLYSLRLLQGHPSLLDNYAFKHVLVDEYQDINHMQHMWLKLFTDRGAKLFCVGDDDQSIYGWRGASIDKILQFSSEFPQAHIVCLEDNYRSTPHILSAASHLISHNEDRHGKVLRTDKASGDKIQVRGLWDSGEEAAFVAQEILKLCDARESLSSMAILVRTGAQTREFEERFTLQHIPYYLVGSTRFYDRMEIRDFLGYMRLIHNEADNLAFERIVNVPRRGIGAATLQALYGIAQSTKISLEQAAQRFSQEGDHVIHRSLRSFLEDIQRWRSLKEEIPLSELGAKVLEESGYMALWQSQGIQGEARLENLKELIKAMEGFASLAEFLDHVLLLSDVNGTSQSEGVALMTLHAAKGLEFDTVFLPGWEENMFPHIRSIEESGKKGVEEERRLAYVGITRARKRSFISFCWNRRGHQGWMPCTPSRFINELPKEDVDLSLRISYGSKEASVDHQKRVIHAVFGEGVVKNHSGHMVSVLFDRHGLKKVIDRFLKFI
jgi:DNA helicase-2/ATP-dependent DNA helicase PcrA